MVETLVYRAGSAETPRGAGGTLCHQCIEAGQGAAARIVRCRRARCNEKGPRIAVDVRADSLLRAEQNATSDLRMEVQVGEADPAANPQEMVGWAAATWP